MTSDDRWTNMTTFDKELDALLSGAAPAPEAPAWCSDVAVLVRTLQAPARPGELAGEADIVARMRELLTTLPVDDGDESLDGEGDVPRLAAVVDEPAEVDDPTDAGDEADGDDEAGEVRRLGAYATTGDEVALPTSTPEPLTERLRSRRGLSDLDDYRAKHGDRSYIAKHAAARLEASRYPVARTVGRVVAMKAAAVTTAVVIGVAAAAAATTGIVATVVVPAINDHVRRPPAVSQSPAEKDDSGTSRGDGRSGGGRDGDDSTSATCSNVLLTCPPAVSDPAEPGAPTPATGAPTATTAPDTTTTTSSTTSTTSTTEPEPPTTTVTTEPPPTTEPQPTTLDAGGG